MKKIILLLALVLFTNLIIAQEKKEYYDNGQLKSIENYVDNIEHGSFIYYYENGTISAEGTMKNGELEGAYSEYNEKGQLKEFTTYKNGDKDGAFKRFWETGELKEEGTYRKNADSWNEPFKIGVYKKYHPNGDMIISAKFGIDEDNDEMLIGKGILNDYYKTDDPYKSILKEETNFLDGEYHGVKKEYYENGELRFKGEFIKGEGVGIHKAYYDNGQLKSNTTFVDGNEIGLYEEYLENGSPSKKGNNGKTVGGLGTYYGEIGNWTYWQYYSNGQLEKKYKKDEYDNYTGNYESYYENGKLKEKGTYKDDDKYGEWAFYFSNGQLEKKQTLDQNGSYTGNYVEFYENGELRFKGEFVDDDKEGEWYQFEDGEKHKFLYENGQLVKSKKVNSINDPIEDQYYKLNFKNKCHKKVQVALIIYNNLDDEWTTKAWFNIKADEEVYLADTQNRIYYFYAHSFDFKNKWEGDFVDTVKGRKYNFRKKTIPSYKKHGDHYNELTCNN